MNVIKTIFIIIFALWNILGGLGLGLPIGNKIFSKKLKKQVPLISGIVVILGDIVLFSFGNLINININF